MPSRWRNKWTAKGDIVVRLMSILYLFPDTNLFIQCQQLESLDWSYCGEFKEINLVICRPVQKEIDHQKSRGGDRVGKKARVTSSTFKEVIANGKKIIRRTNPAVTLLVEPQWLPFKGLDGIEYGKVDDELVASIYAFRKATPNADVRLITHDSGPMGTAKMLGIPFVSIPDAWLIPPESNKAERTINRLQSEVRRLQKAEPVFQIECRDFDGKSISSIVLEHPVFEPLTASEIDGLITGLKQRFPMLRDYGDSSRTEHPQNNMLGHALGLKRITVPATEDDINKYQNEKYPGWIAHCTKFFEHLHLDLQQACDTPSFRFVAENTGTRPGRSTLVSVEAKGNFEICAKQADKLEKERIRVELPCPPDAPHSKRMTMFGNSDLGNVLDTVTRFSVVQNALGRRAIDFPVLRRDNRRDPNGFYWKPRRPDTPCILMSLECEQWRHGVDEEHFDGDFVIEKDVSRVEGALSLRIDAENLSDSETLVVPVRIDITLTRSIDRAEKLVDDMVMRTELGTGWK